MNNEVWKDIVGYEGLYQVSNMGQVRSLDRVITMKNGVNQFHKGYIIKSKANNSGYLTVNLHKNGVSSTKTIHRLVALHFVDGYFDGAEVNHKDENKLNNSHDNLEWVNKDTNLNYGTRIDRCSVQSNKKVIQLDENYTIVKIWDGIRIVERETGFNRTSIIRCCKGKQKTAYGFHWKYYEEVV